MPKQANSFAAKVRQICQEYPNEFSATPVSDLRCNLCDVLVKCDKSFLWKATEKVSNTIENANLFTTRSSKFQGTCCLFILSCRYPTSETEPSFFKVPVCFNEKVLPLDTAARACVAKVAFQKEQIQELLRNKNFFNCE